MDKVHFLMLVGLPASGKSTKSKELAEKYDPIRSHSHKQENEDGLKF